MDITRTICKVYNLISTIIKRNPVPKEWTHITKIDPELEKKLPILYPIYLQHTDAVSVGGSNGVSAENTEVTFELLEYVSVPAFHEPSSPNHVTEKTFDQSRFTAIPEVLNGDTASLIGKLGEGISHLQDEMIPQLLSDKLLLRKEGRLNKTIASIATSYILNDAIFEAYIIQNPDSAAAERGGVTEADVLSSMAARERGMAADRHLGSEIVYLEYSGIYGGEEACEILENMSDDMSRAQVWYGGGIDSNQKSSEMLDSGADAVIVGDIFHQIASDEISIFKQAVKFFNHKPSQDEIYNWIQDVVEVPSLASTQYLDSIPDVNHPKQVAIKYLATSINLLFLFMCRDKFNLSQDHTTNQVSQSRKKHALFITDEQNVEIIDNVISIIYSGEQISEAMSRHLSIYPVLDIY